MSIGAGGHDERETHHSSGRTADGPTTWRVVALVIGVGLMLVRCGLDSAHEQAQRDDAVRSLSESLAAQRRAPEWHGCPVQVGLSDELSPEVLVSAKAALLDITERTGFPLSVTEGAESARLWITSIDVDESPISTAELDEGDSAPGPAELDPEQFDPEQFDPEEFDPEEFDGVESSRGLDTESPSDPAVLSIVQHSEGVAMNAIVNISPTAAPDRLEWELRRSVGRLLVGDADISSPPRPLGGGVTAPVDQTAEPPYDVEALRRAAASCTSLDEIAEEFGALEWDSCPSQLAVAGRAPNGSLVAISGAVAQLYDETGWSLSTVNGGVYWDPVLALDDGRAFIDVDSESAASLVVAWTDSSTIAELVSPSGSTPPELLTLIRRDDARVIGGVVLIDDAVPLEQVREQLPGALSRLAVGSADVFDPALADFLTTTVADGSDEDVTPEVDAEAVRSATAGC